MTKIEQTEILIIGAGPAGAVAAALLRRQGPQVVVLEREQFPRFSIGESLLPQSMEYLQQAGMLQAVVEHGFQFKNGASFVHRERQTAFDFRDKYSAGWGTTYQVQRADFDHLLATQAQLQGADVRYQHTVTAVDLDGAEPHTHVRDADGNEYVMKSKFILDASGFGRVLPRLLDLERPSSFPLRAACFTHITDGIRDPAFDRNKIRITIHPEHHDVWYWLIPFAQGRCSIGVVAESAFLAAIPGDDASKLHTLAMQDPALHQLLQHAQWDTPVRSLSGYAADVTSLWGKGYALLGNAGEFLDPIFSSGVTIALKSASLAAAVLQRQLAGDSVDWEQDYAVPLKQGVDTFRVFVESWYTGGFQNVIFHAQQEPAIRRMISSILAGYAWDRSNPFVAENKRRLSALEQLCT